MRSVLPVRMLCALAAVVALGAGCAVGPDTGPALVIDNGDDRNAAATDAGSPPPPQLATPTADLPWRPCAAAVSNRFGLPAVVAGVQVDCADYRSSITPGVTTVDAVVVSAVRVRLVTTPVAAAPLVLTSGTDLPSALTAMLLATSPGRTLLNDHPVVAIDRRGIGDSSPLDCLTVRERNTLLDNGFDSNDIAGGITSREARLTSTAAEAADGCSETISPYQVAFTAANAASDLERLRTIWKVDRVGMLGVGSGADVVLAYAGLYRNRVARIILDTPTPYLASALVRGQQAAAGTDAALAQLSILCAAARCALGSDPRGAIGGLIEQAAQGRLATLSDADVLSAVSTDVALTTSDRTDTISDVANRLQSAITGNVTPLTAAVARARATRGADGQLVSRCNDTSQPVGQNEIGNLVTSWTQQYPLTGADTALSLLRCNGWPAGPAAPRPTGFDVGVLILNGGNDTINGATGAGAVAPLVLRAGGSSSTVTWDGLGYSVAAHSDCAAEIVGRYANTGLVPASGACPS